MKMEKRRKKIEMPSDYSIEQSNWVRYPKGTRNLREGGEWMRWFFPWQEKPGPSSASLPEAEEEVSFKKNRTLFCLPSHCSFFFFCAFLCFTLTVGILFGFCVCHEVSFIFSTCVYVCLLSFAACALSHHFIFFFFQEQLSVYVRGACKQTQQGKGAGGRGYSSC